MSTPLSALDHESAPPRAATRRTVVVAAGVATAAVGVPASLKLLPGVLGGAGSAPVVLDRASFTPHVGRTFDATLGGDRHRLELTGVLDVEGLPDDPDSFVAVFRAPAALEHGTYELARSGFPSAPVFLVPGGLDEERTLAAVFNRVEGPR